MECSNVAVPVKDVASSCSSLAGSATTAAWGGARTSIFEKEKNNNLLNFPHDQNIVISSIKKTHKIALGAAVCS